MTHSWTPAERHLLVSNVLTTSCRQKTERAAMIGYCSDTSEADFRTHSSFRRVRRVR